MMIEEVALPYLNLKASQNNALVRKPNSFMLVVELTYADDTDVQWHFCINFEQKTFDHVNYSFFSTWLAFEITGQSVSCFLALQSHHLFLVSFVQCFYSSLKEWPKYFKFSVSVALAGCNGRKLTGRSKPGRSNLNE